ncbi:MAG: HEAT repeat domain-containing protein [Mariprofundales bacterium]|nr:HEAT repeat domain-containing protein [Mariprofundales bacterium]
MPAKVACDLLEFKGKISSVLGDYQLYAYYTTTGAPLPPTMEMIHNIFSAHSKLSPAARKAWSISRQLFKAREITAEQIESLLAIDSDAIAPFRMELTKNGNRHGSARREQIVDAIGNSSTADNHRSTAIALLASFIDDQEGMTGAKAITHLSAYGAQVTGILLKALSVGNRWSRSYAARSLGTIGGIRSVSGLINALQDEDKRVRSDAAEALGRIGDSQATQPLFKALADPNWLVRESASSALATFSDQEMIDRLTKFMNSEEHHIRAQAVRTLGNINHPDALEPLIAALNDRHFEVQWDAIDALATSNSSAATPALLAHYHTGDRELRRRIMAGCNTIGIDHVAAQLTHPDPAIRTAAAEIIGQQQKSSLLDDLTAAWQQERDHEVQMWLVIAMGQIAATTASQTPDHTIKTLIAAAASPHRPVSYHATKALEALPHPLAEQYIQQRATPTTIDINCPSCLYTLRLTPPLTKKRWHCPHCSLGFTIRQDAAGALIISPTTKMPPTSTTQSKRWFDILQVDQHADAATIQQAFRQLLKQCHPDRVANLGAEFQQLATQKTRTLTQALRTGLEECRQRERSSDLRS